VTAGLRSDRRLKIVVYVAALVGYMAVGYWLQVGHGFIMGDALSRVSAAQSVLFSREPNLAAIGFIFTPLTAMVQLPWIVVSPLWPAMTERAFSGTIMSAIFMAGAVIQILGVGTDRRLPRWYSLSIAVLFALNPMIIFYGSNGMSEAPFIFFLAWAVRRLVMWMVDDDVHHPATTGTGAGHQAAAVCVCCCAACVCGKRAHDRIGDEPAEIRAAGVCAGGRDITSALTTSPSAKPLSTASRRRFQPSVTSPTTSPG